MQARIRRRNRLWPALRRTLPRSGTPTYRPGWIRRSALTPARRSLCCSDAATFAPVGASADTMKPSRSATNCRRDRHRRRRKAPALESLSCRRICPQRRHCRRDVHPDLGALQYGDVAAVFDLAGRGVQEVILGSSFCIRRITPSSMRGRPHPGRFYEVVDRPGQVGRALVAMGIRGLRTNERHPLEWRRATCAP